MNTIKIPKKSGGTRTIYVPSRTEKDTLRGFIGKITDNVIKADTNKICHGFMPGRSPVTNAAAHVGFTYTTCFDLENFFDSVRLTHIGNKLSKDIIAHVLVDGAPRQGLPTSPAVANLAAQPMDEAIIRFLRKRYDYGKDVVYTRYADDLTFSYNDVNIGEAIRQNIPNIIKTCGFTVNSKKTRTMYAGAGRRVITGVAVDSGIHATRKVRRKLRAALHQQNVRSAKGLKEWAALKFPRERSYQEDLLRWKNHFKINSLKISSVPQRGPDEWYVDDVVITGDPIYILGMSTFARGWTSCMNWNGGQYKRTTIGYVYTKGIRVALLLGNNIKTIAGVTRREILARTIIADCENGNSYYRSFYGLDEQKNILRNVLINNGYSNSCYPSTKVVGFSPVRFPYLDQFSSKEVNGKYFLYK